MIRRYQPEDRERILLLHEAHGKGYFFADPEEPPNIETLVEEEKASIVGAMTARATIEAFLMVDPKMNAVKRWRTIKRLMEAGMPIVHGMGYREAHVAVPSELAGYASLLARQHAFYPEPRLRLIVNLTEALDGKR